MFYTYKDLTSALWMLKKAGCVKAVKIWHPDVHLFYITNLGVQVLDTFPNWKAKQVISLSKVVMLPNYKEREEKENKALKVLKDGVVVPLWKKYTI